MKRRQLLRRFSVGGTLLTAGCATLGDQPGPFTFAIVNRRERAYAVEFTLWDDADEALVDVTRTRSVLVGRREPQALVDGAVDVAPCPSGDEYTALTFDDLVRVTNGDEIDARVRITGDTFEGTYEVTCARRENAENNYFFDIRHPDAPTESERGMGFRGSEC